MKKLETILREIQARKVDFNRKEFIDWLDSYADYYKKTTNNI